MLALDANAGCTAILDNHEAVTGTRKGEIVIWSMRTGKVNRQMAVGSADTLSRTGLSPAVGESSFMIRSGLSPEIGEFPSLRLSPVGEFHTLNRAELSAMGEFPSLSRTGLSPYLVSESGLWEGRYWFQCPYHTYTCQTDIKT